jgi:hypothetical protein
MTNVNRVQKNSSTGFVFWPQRPDLLWGQPVMYPVDTVAVSAGVKLPEIKGNR